MREPVVREPNAREKVPALVADLSVRGVWQPQATTFFDVRVVDSDANSYLHRDVGAVRDNLYILSLVQFFPRLSTLRKKNTHKLLKQSMHHLL